MYGNRVWNTKDNTGKAKGKKCHSALHERSYGKPPVQLHSFLNLELVIFFTWSLYHQKITPVLCMISGFCCNVNELHSSGILYWVEWKLLAVILGQPIGPK